jgi:phage repressor protein C with HTH and peptisase S24 domain
MFMIRRVEGVSMQPVYRPGAIVLGLRKQKPRVGSIVIANLNGREIIKRVARMSEQGFFLLGDNADHSSDSRKYGWFERSAIKSVIIGSIKR